MTLSKCYMCGAEYPSAPLGTIHKCGRCPDGYCERIEEDNNMVKSTDIAVNEKTRKLVFSSGEQATFHNVTWFNGTGSFLRFGCDEGYVLANTKNIDYIVVDGERVS